ncbi:MAG: hypothetical protein EB141_02925 [Verrucomicrobia bacterium]|nr:hypothetical protein [Verrucomicrobiota bacterium]
MAEQMASVSGFRWPMTRMSLMSATRGGEGGIAIAATATQRKPRGGARARLPSGTVPPTGTSRQCFNVLHDHRCLSVHFMLDLDGTIYQTLDLKERAWHATTSNTRSIGIEVANIGAFAPGQQRMFEEWYQRDNTGWPRVVVPARFGEPGILTPNFIARPARKELVVGSVQGRQLQQYDFTPQQYAALIKLTATLCKVFPKIRCDYPRGADGQLLTSKLPDEVLNKYQGILGHYHVQTNKVDPGPAFQWEHVIGEAKNLLK